MTSLWLYTHLVAGGALLQIIILSLPERVNLTELLLEIQATVGQDVPIVQVVFPNPSLVLQVFLQSYRSVRAGLGVPSNLSSVPEPRGDLDVMLSMHSMRVKRHHRLTQVSL